MVIKSMEHILLDPTHIYIHRFKPDTFSRRKDSAAVLTKTKFYFLWCMQTDIKVNLGCRLASQFSSVLKANRPLILVYLNSQFVFHEGLINQVSTNLHVTCEMLPLDIQCLHKTGMVWQKDSVYHLRAGIPPPQK